MKTLITVLLMLLIISQISFANEVKQEKSETDKLQAQATANIARAEEDFKVALLNAQKTRETSEAEASADSIKATNKTLIKLAENKAQLEKIKITLEEKKKLAAATELASIEKANKRLAYVKAHPNEKSWTTVLTLGMF
jgi:hypothetical protein